MRPAARKASITVCVLVVSALACGGPASAPSATPPPAATHTALTPAPTAAPSPTLAPSPTPMPLVELADGIFLAPEAPPPPTDLVDVLRDRVADGTITLEEGLVAAIGLLADQPDSQGVLGSAVPVSGEANRLFWLAQQYVANGPNAAARAELQRLLTIIAPSPELLESNAAPQSSSAASGSPRAAPNLRPSVDEASCHDLWAKGFPSGSSEICLQFASVPLSGGIGRIFYPAAWLPGDPRLTFVQASADALGAADGVFAALGPLHSMDVVFTLLGTSEGEKILAATTTGDKNAAICQMVLYPSVLAKTMDEFKQTVAHEVFHCFQLWNIPAHVLDHYPDATAWWIEGSAEYFSNVVYPAVNFEWEWVDVFDNKSIDASLMEMSYENAVFFQYLGNILGDDGLVALLQTFPASSDRQASADALAAYPGMQQIFHDFAELWADQGIADTGGGYLPNLAFISSKDQPEIGASVDVPLPARPWVVKRYLLTYAPENVYSNNLTSGGSNGLESAQLSGQTGFWDQLPASVVPGCDDDGIFVVLVTSAAAGTETHEATLHAAAQSDDDCREPDEADEAVGQTACDHPFLPLRPGATWTYSTTSGPASEEVISVEGDRTSATAVMLRRSGDTETEVVWICSPSGLTRYQTIQHLGGAGDMVTTGYELSGVFMPGLSALAVGVEWDYIESLQVNSEAPPGANIPDSPGTIVTVRHFLVEAIEEMVVDGQPIDGLRLAVTGTATTQFTFEGFTSKPIVGDLSGTTIYGRGIGLVQGRSGTLMSYTIP